jgi:thiopeptide-type bacteriocin biosynthesis protein
MRLARHRSHKGTVPQLDTLATWAEFDRTDALLAHASATRDDLRAARDSYRWHQLEATLRMPVPANPSAARDLQALRARVGRHFETADTLLWYMHKPPGLRVRIGIPLSAGHADLTDCLGHGFAFARSSRSYEPEYALFGAGPSLRFAHEIFSHDAALIAQLADVSEGRPATAPWLASLLITAILMDSLDVVGWEDRSVWENVWSLGQRSAIGAAVSLDGSAPVIRESWRLVRSTERDLLPALAKDAAFVEPLRQYQHAVRTAAASAEAADAFADPLGPGVREFLAFVVIFLWNRLAVGPAAQAAIAKALMVTG